MLDAMRKRTGSLVVKLFIGLLALSFAVWGIGDIFRGSQDPTVVDVGGTAIRASDPRRRPNAQSATWHRNSSRSTPSRRTASRKTCCCRTAAS